MTVLKPITEIEQAYNLAMQLQNSPQVKDKKFSIYLKRFAQNVKGIVKEYYQDMEDARIEAAATDDKGNIVWADDKRTQFTYTKESYKQLVSTLRELQSQSYDVEVIASTVPIPEGLEPVFEDYFSVPQEA